MSLSPTFSTESTLKHLLMRGQSGCTCGTYQFYIVLHALLEILKQLARRQSKNRDLRVRYLRSRQEMNEQFSSTTMLEYSGSYSLLVLSLLFLLFPRLSLVKFSVGKQWHRYSLAKAKSIHQGMRHLQTSQGWKEIFFFIIKYSALCCY